VQLVDHPAVRPRARRRRTALARRPLEVEEEAAVASTDARAAQVVAPPPDFAAGEAGRVGVEQRRAAVDANDVLEALGRSGGDAGPDREGLGRRAVALEPQGREGVSAADLEELDGDVAGTGVEREADAAGRAPGTERGQEIDPSG